LKHSDSGDRPRADARAGFALIEMLAALTIGVAILAVLAQFTSQSLRNWNRGESTIAVMEMLTSGLSRLKADLALAVPMRPPGSDSASVVFAGEGAQLLFVAATGFGAGDRGLELISVTVTKDGEDTVVVRQRGQVTTGRTPLRDPVVLLRGRLKVGFSYRDDDGRIVPTWSNRQQLPKAVAVDITNNAGTALFPAPVLLKLPANLAAACLTSTGSEGDATGASNACPGANREERTQNPPGEQQ
jgi:general secretion pathway protein J